VTLKEIADILEATVLVDSDNEKLTIESACSSDMMSAVLYYHAPNAVLITGLTQPQVIRTAEIAGIKMIVFAFDKKPEQVTIDMARQKRIPILTTRLCMYSASGRLFQTGLPGCSGK
jgi:predicted transcriptional regulator